MDNEPPLPTADKYPKPLLILGAAFLPVATMVAYLELTHGSPYDLFVMLVAVTMGAACVWQIVQQKSTRIQTVSLTIYTIGMIATVMLFSFLYVCERLGRCL